MSDISVKASFCSTIQRATIRESWTAACRSFDVTTKDTLDDDVDIGDVCWVTMGDYVRPVDPLFPDTDWYQLIGYIDSIQKDKASGTTQVSGRDILRRAVDKFLIVFSDDTGEFKTTGLDASEEMRAILVASGIPTGSISTSPTGFTFEAGVEFALMSAWDALREICEIGQWRVAADSSGGVVIGNGRIVAPAPSYTITDAGEILRASYSITDNELINKVVVLGAAGVYATAVDADSPIAWEKTAVISRNWIPDLVTAQAIADDNLSYYNSLTEVGQITVAGHPELHVGVGIGITEAVGYEIGLNGNWLVYAVERTVDQSGMLSVLTLRR